MSELNYFIYELQKGNPELPFVLIGALLLVFLVWADVEKYVFKAIAFSSLAVALTVGALYFATNILS